jgi:hypothetical protein
MAFDNRASKFKYIAGAATTQVKTGRGRLRRITFNKPVASSTVTLIDGTSGTTANMGIITNTSDVKPYDLEYNLVFQHGLRIVTSGADDITVVYE